MTEKTVLSEEEKKQRIQELLAELKELRATPRSDWHAAFEALLRIETFRFGDKVHIHTEEEIGEERLIRDPKDRPILRAALDAHADLFLTGDKDFLESAVRDPRIISAADFLALTNDAGR